MKAAAAISAILSAMVLAVFAPQTASGLDISYQSRTYILARETAGSQRLIPLYEYLDLRVESPGNASFYFGGWGRVSLKGELSEKRTNTDLQYAYFNYGTNALNMKLGRFYMFEGVAREQVDGLYAGLKWKGFGVSAYGGSPVEADFDDRGGDSIYGGRVSHSFKGIYGIGASYLKEENDSSAFREEAGVDVRLMPFKKFEVQGSSIRNMITSKWSEHSYYAYMGPFAGLSLRAGSSHVRYRDFFQSLTTSAFGSFDPNEEMTTAGAGAEYSFSGFTVSADFKRHDYELSGGADYYGGKLSYSKPGLWAGGASMHRMNGDAEKLKYTEMRAYVYKKIKKTDITVDFINVNYEKEINGVDDSYSVSLAAGYEISGNARVAADMEYSRTPDFDRDVKALVKFIYRPAAPRRI